MHINVNIVLSEGEEFPMTPEEAAQTIIDALDGVSPEGDYCGVIITSTTQGAVGYVAPPPPPLPPPTPENGEPPVAVQLPVMPPEITPYEDG